MGKISRRKQFKNKNYLKTATITAILFLSAIIPIVLETSTSRGLDKLLMVKNEPLSFSPPKMEWSKTFGDENNDFFYSVVQADDRGYVMAGYIYNVASGEHFGWCVKVDANGGIQWNKAYSLTYSTDFYSITKAVDGGYAIAGSIGHNACLIKIDTNGNLQWSRTYASIPYHGFPEWPVETNAYSITQTRDNGYILAGSILLPPDLSKGKDFYLIKTDENGVLQWNATFGGSNDEIAFSVAQTSDGGYILAGYTESFGSGGRDVYVVKTDGNGHHQWNITYGGSDWDTAYSITQTKDGGYILAGLTHSFGYGDGDFLALKISRDGSIQWSRTYNGIGQDMAYSVIQSVDGGYILAGKTYEPGLLEDTWVVRIDEMGNHLWNATFGGESVDRGRSIIQTFDGGFILVGDTGSFGNLQQGWLMKIGTDDADGDGLLDHWEKFGIDYNGDGVVDLDLPALGANWQRKDIFVEIDYMEFHRPNLNAEYG